MSAGFSNLDSFDRFLLISFSSFIQQAVTSGRPLGGLSQVELLQFARMAFSRLGAMLLNLQRVNSHHEQIEQFQPQKEACKTLRK
jgi:hypothetical protein